LKNYLVVLILSFTFACGSKPEHTNTDIDSKDTISDWARPGAQKQMSGAYFIYKNPLNVADTLLSVESNASMMAQIHESYTTDDGLASMREMKQIIIAPNETLVLQRGGTHLMLMELKKDLANGDSINVQLTFTQAGKIDLSLPVLSSN